MHTSNTDRPKPAIAARKRNAARRAMDRAAALNAEAEQLEREFNDARSGQLAR